MRSDKKILISIAGKVIIPYWLINVLKKYYIFNI